MRSLLSTLAVVALACAAGLALGAVTDHAEPRAEAGTAVRLDTAGMVDRSAWVVEGRVTQRRTVERLDGSLDTEYTLAVTQEFLGGGDGRDSLRLPGGTRADGSGMVVPGVPRLEVGEEVVLFLTEEASDRSLTVGLGQGRYTLLVDRDGVRRALRSGSRTALLGRDDADGTRGNESVPYAELIAEIEAAVNARASRGGASDVR